MLGDYKPLEEPLIVVEGASFFQSKGKLQFLPFLVAQSPADLGEPPAVAPKELVIIDVLASCLKGDADMDLACLTGAPDFGSRASIPSDYGPIREAPLADSSPFARRLQT